MKEDFLHYIWRYGLYSQKSLVTRDNLPVKIIHEGTYNTDAGPDFQFSKIKIGTSIWVGHVEIHIKASDWYRHGHQNDPAYDQVVLHVVQVDDRVVRSGKGNRIPTICLHFSAKYYDNFQHMINQIAPIPCAEYWTKLPSIQIDNAISTMGVERMESRFQWLQTKLNSNKGGWKDLYLQVFFRAFGFGKNQDNFEFLATTIPYMVIAKHRFNLFQLESLIFGQAGLIPDHDMSPYPKALRTEYIYLKKKYCLQQHTNIMWRSRRTRPANQPIWRLAQLAAWIHQTPDLFETVRNAGVSHTTVSLETYVSSYWKTHSDFGKRSSFPPPVIGKAASRLIHINAVLPLNAFYNSLHFENHTKIAWLEVLENMPPEQNSILKLWKSAGFRVPSAFYSQAFLYMYKNFCVHRSCLSCRIGQMVLKA